MVSNQVLPVRKPPQSTTLFQQRAISSVLSFSALVPIGRYREELTFELSLWVKELALKYTTRRRPHVATSNMNCPKMFGWMQVGKLADAWGFPQLYFGGYGHTHLNESITVMTNGSELLDTTRHHARHIELQQPIDVTGLFLPSSSQHILGDFLPPGIESIRVRCIDPPHCSFDPPSVLCCLRLHQRVSAGQRAFCSMWHTFSHKSLYFQMRDVLDTRDNIPGYILTHCICLSFKRRFMPCIVRHVT